MDAYVPKVKKGKKAPAIPSGKTPEAAVKSDIDNLLRKYQYINTDGREYYVLWWYKPQAGIYGRAGIPDFIGCYNGRFFGIEAKVKPNTLTANQYDVIQKIDESGGVSFVIYGRANDPSSLGWDSLTRWLEEQKNAFIARDLMQISGNHAYS